MSYVNWNKIEPEAKDLSKEKKLLICPACRRAFSTRSLPDHLTVNHLPSRCLQIARCIHENCSKKRDVYSQTYITDHLYESACDHKFIVPSKMCLHRVNSQTVYDALFELAIYLGFVKMTVDGKNVIYTSLNGTEGQTRIDAFLNKKLPISELVLPLPHMGTCPSKPFNEHACFVTEHIDEEKRNGNMVSHQMESYQHAQRSPAYARSPGRSPGRSPSGYRSPGASPPRGGRSPGGPGGRNPGYRSPGPGGRSPGGRSPGGRSPGGRSPGGRSPGPGYDDPDECAGGRSPGYAEPVRHKSRAFTRVADEEATHRSEDGPAAKRRMVQVKSEVMDEDGGRNANHSTDSRRTSAPVNWSAASTSTGAPLAVQYRPPPPPPPSVTATSTQAPPRREFAHSANASKFSAHSSYNPTNPFSSYSSKPPSQQSNSVHSNGHNGFNGAQNSTGKFGGPSYCGGGSFPVPPPVLPPGPPPMMGYPSQQRWIGGSSPYQHTMNQYNTPQVVNGAQNGYPNVPHNRPSAPPPTRIQLPSRGILDDEEDSHDDSKKRKDRESEKRHNGRRH